MSFTVYKSSAGSGKTFTLVREYLKMILPEPLMYRHILAITFTNKAANEMKERVLNNLRELAKTGSERDKKVTRDLLPYLINESGLTEEMIREKATRALKLILHNYSDFAIGTIDSFSHRVIRSFAHDFGLPVNFNVELDSDELIETAVDLLLDKTGDDEDLTRFLVRFLESRMDEDQSWNIDKILMDFARVLLDEEGMSHLRKLHSLSLPDFERIVPEIYKQIKAFENSIRSIALEAVQLIDKYSIPLAAFYQGEKGIGGYFDKLSKGRMDLLNSDGYASASVNEDKWISSKADSISQKNIVNIKPALTEFFLKILQVRERDQGYYKFLNLLTRTIYPLAVLKEIDQTLKEFKKQNNIVHISEFNRRIAEIVLNEPVPFIYERLGEKYNHVLIDEFQDTSRLQWSNLQPLVENSLASGYFNLVVGDGKQAIYRWRNGDVQQFAQLPVLPGSRNNRLVADRERILKNNFQSFQLNKNFRSTAEIVNFNNRLFSAITDKFSAELDHVYDNLIQEFDPSDTGGHVSIEFIDSSKGTVIYRDSMIQRVLEIIRDLELNHFQLKDIAVLCRKNKDGNEIARFLIRNGIPVISSESLLLSGSAEVKFITGIMQVINDPANPVIAAEVVTFLYQKQMIRAGNLHQVLSRINTKDPGIACLELIKEQGFDLSFRKLSIQPVFELCEELISLFGLNLVPDPYLQFFLDAVLKYSGKHSTSQSAFLEWWERHKDKLSVIIPEGLNAVRIMSIHKAKGLQFPVVIFPFADEKKRFGKNYLWVDIPENKLNGLTVAMLKPHRDMLETDYKAEYEEESNNSLIDLVNTFYVAMTRPEEHLYVLSQIPSRSVNKTPSIPGFFESYLKGAGEWEEEKLRYEYGNAVRHESNASKKVEGSTSVLPSFIYNDWRNKIHIRAKAPEVWNMDDPQKKSKWGNLVHLVLSRITTVNDLDRVVDEVITSGLVDERDKEKLAGTIYQIIENSLVKSYFAEGVNVRKEAEILLENGNVLRPDRVILENHKAIVIDYKTGKIRESHANQLNNYEFYLKEMGYTDIRKILLYTEPEIEVIEVQ